MTLPYADARKLVDDARARGAELGKALSIAVVDYGGFVVVIERMDGARPMTPSIALSKAYSAAVMQRPTYMLEGWRNSDPVFFTQVGRMGQHPIVATKGGYTLKREGAIVGGIGISGGSPDEDQKICEDVLRAAGFDLDFPEWAGTRLSPGGTTPRTPDVRGGGPDRKNRDRIRPAPTDKSFVVSPTKVAQYPRKTLRSTPGKGA
jgi:uncharacterized protein GlcG (DUF336 family)